MNLFSGIYLLFFASEDIIFRILVRYVPRVLGPVESLQQLSQVLFVGTSGVTGFGIALCVVGMYQLAAFRMTSRGSNWGRAMLASLLGVLTFVTLPISLLAGLLVTLSRHTFE